MVKESLIVNISLVKLFFAAVLVMTYVYSFQKDQSQSPVKEKGKYNTIADHA